MNQSSLSQETLGRIIGEVTAQVLKQTDGGMHTKAPGNAGSFTPLHGVTNVGAGIFSGQGLDRDVISTVVTPYGISSMLPFLPSVDTDPRYAALTGVSDDIGDEPASPCNVAPSGYIKACNLTAAFGRVARATETIDFDDVMLRINRGDFKDLRLIGSVLGDTNFTPDGLDPNQILDVVTMSEMIQASVRLERKLNTHVWQGNPANNNAGGGYAEFPGLDLQIATGQKDANTGTLCPSLDSDVKDFTYNNVDGTGAKDIVEYLSMIEFFLTELARDTDMEPVRWVLAMRAGLWQELSAAWPCAYNTNRCGAIGGTNARVITDGRENIRDRDAMRQNKTIQINGNDYPVITDTGIYEQNSTNDANLAAGELASSIYMLPITVRGNFPVTYMEYLDYSRGAADTRLLEGKNEYWVTNGGRFSWAMDNNYWCYDMQVKAEHRVILRTPQLAGKIDNVKYVPLQHLREADPDSPYWVDGGVSFRSAPAKNAVWL